MITDDSLKNVDAAKTCIRTLVETMPIDKAIDFLNRLVDELRGKPAPTDADRRRAEETVNRMQTEKRQALFGEFVRTRNIN